MASGHPNFQVPRDTQRVPRSCIQCSRRKIKCSKRIPCEACVRRGDSLACTREIVRVNGQVTIALDPVPALGSGDQEQLLSENISLRARVEQLETLLNHDKDSRRSISNLSPVVVDTLDSPQPPEDIVTTFEGLHLGGPGDGLPKGPSRPAAPSNENILSLFPIRESSLKIVEFSLSTLGWVHCSLNAPRFLTEHNTFWDSLEANDRTVLNHHSWLAVYLSVLAVGAYFWDEEEVNNLHYVHEGFSGRQAPAIGSVAAELIDVSHAWYEAALSELNLSDFFSKPQLSTVQTIAILMLLHRNFGEAHREYFLLGLTVNVARSLGLDHLGQEDTNFRINRSSRWTDRKDRELGRRLWWTLVICDWMTVFSRPSSITPESFSSILDIEHDRSHRDIILENSTHDIEALNQIPSPLEYHIILSKIAYVVHAHVRSIKRSPVGVFEALRKLDEITQTLPLHLQTTEDDSLISETQHFEWASIQRRQLANLLQVCRIDLCFSCLPRLLETGEDEYSLQDCGLQAAEKVVEMQHWNQSNVAKKFWGTTACLIASGVFLIVDLICFKNSKSEVQSTSQLRTIESCIKILQDSTTSKVDGSAVLKRLLHLHYIGFAGQVVDRQMLLKIMKLASNTAITSMNNDGSESFQGDTSQWFEDGARNTREITSFGQPSQYSVSTLGQGVSFDDLNDSFQTDMAINLDYMSFDMAQDYTSMIDDSGMEMNAFEGLVDRHTQ